MSSRALQIGVTLIEIAISMAVLSVSLAGLLLLLISGQNLTRRAEKRLVAIQLARQEMERLRSLEFSHLGVGSGFLPRVGLSGNGWCPATPRRRRGLDRLRSAAAAEGRAA